jgi:DNA-directed RNA polymerase specialized sigma24 family protein
MGDLGGTITMTARLLPEANFRYVAGIPIAWSGLGISGPPPAAGSAISADEAVIKLHGEQARPLVGLAALLVWLAAGSASPVMAGSAATARSFKDSAATAGLRPGEFAMIAALPVPEVVSGIAEEIVHDAFTAMHREWRKLRDLDRAAAFLHRAIVHGSRTREHALQASAPGHDGAPSPESTLPVKSALSPETTLSPESTLPPDGIPSPDNTLPSGDGTPTLSARVLATLRRLPGRQCEALVLRYYADLPEAQAAAAMGVTRAAFRGHATRGMSALRHGLREH